MLVGPVDVRLPRGDEADAIDTVAQPDVLVVCDPARIDRRTYERAGVREYWLVHPGDRTRTVYVLDKGHFGRLEIYELKDTIPIGVLPDVSIAWDALVERLPKQEY